MTKPLIDNNKTNQTCRLSVQISLTGLSFLVSSQQGDIVFYHEKELERSYTPEELLLEMDTTLRGTPELAGAFEVVQLIYSTPTYCTVPQTLFDENKASEYLKFNTKILSNDYIAHDTLKSQGIVVVYVPFMNINNYIFERYGGFEYYHSISVLLSDFLNTEKHNSEEKVYLHVKSNEFDCIVIRQGELQLCNTYSYQTPEDFIYYVLFCLEQLKLNPDNVNTSLCGSIVKSDEKFEFLYTYIRNISFVTREFPPFGEEEGHEKYVLKTNSNAYNFRDA
ncbi:DUF3822 family protein [Aureisphaera galaxeae]|uniref:DUF3822 family protein n=1 Tax=Aureisphaera galaxeae TaxID=1538023 RepID=UPI002350C61D|nr:DUF3822 family protein [Aureisphaera galaxeae]MDC8004112.1 DUF3822 family protein [Aureisphaera galaxeae]